MMVHCTNLGMFDNIVYFRLKSFFTLKKCLDPAHMQNYAVFIWAFTFAKYSFRGFPQHRFSIFIIRTQYHINRFVMQKYFSDIRRFF